VAAHELLDAVADRSRREDVARARPPEIERVVRAPRRIGKPPVWMPEVTRKVVDMLWGCEGDDELRLATVGFGIEDVDAR